MRVLPVLAVLACLLQPPPSSGELVAAAAAAPPPPSDRPTGPRVNLVAPVHREYAAVGVLVHAMLAQTDPRWTLTLVSDGPDPRVGELVEVS